MSLVCILAKQVNYTPTTRSNTAVAATTSPWVPRTLILFARHEVQFFVYLCKLITCCSIAAVVTVVTIPTLWYACAWAIDSVEFETIFLSKENHTHLEVAFKRFNNHVLFDHFHVYTYTMHARCTQCSNAHQTN